MHSFSAYFRKRYENGSSNTSSNGVNGGKKEALNSLMCCAVSPDGQRFVTGGDDSVIRVYDLTKPGIDKEVNRCCST